MSIEKCPICWDLLTSRPYSDNYYEKFTRIWKVICDSTTDVTLKCRHSYHFHCLQRCCVSYNPGVSTDRFATWLKELDQYSINNLDGLKLHGTVSDAVDAASHCLQQIDEIYHLKEKPDDMSSGFWEHMQQHPYNARIESSNLDIWLHKYDQLQSNDKPDEYRNISKADIATDKELKELIDLAKNTYADESMSFAWRSWAHGIIYEERVWFDWIRLLPNNELSEQERSIQDYVCILRFLTRLNTQGADSVFDNHPDSENLKDWYSRPCQPSAPCPMCRAPIREQGRLFNEERNESSFFAMISDGLTLSLAPMLYLMSMTYDVRVEENAESSTAFDPFAESNYITNVVIPTIAVAAGVTVFRVVVNRIRKAYGASN